MSLRTMLFALLLGCINLSAEKVTVYLVDSGVKADHNDIKDVEMVQVNFIEEDEKAYGAHGTYLAGVVLARAPEIKLVSIRTLNDAGDGKWSDFLRGINWILNYHKEGQPAVANLSFGGIPSDPRIEKIIKGAIEQLIRKGVTVVVAAGNEAKNELDRFPANLESAISVGAVSLFNFRLSNSNYGDMTDIYARGENLKGSAAGGSSSRIRESGTSAAAALVTGHIADHLKTHPNLSPAEVFSWVISNSTAGKVKNLPKDSKKKKALLFNFD